MGSLTDADRSRIEEELQTAIDALPLPGEPGETLRGQMRAAVAGGKRFRPELVIRSFRSFTTRRPEPAALWHVAAAFELLHGAFVVHDDIIDQDTRRRGVLNVRGTLAQDARRTGEGLDASRRVGDAGALLVGDLLLYAASRTLLTAAVRPPIRGRLVAHLDEAIAVSAVGEWADATRGGTDSAAALRMTADKTAAYSFSAPLRCGALMAGAGGEDDRDLAGIGIHLGIAFQLVDDLIGAFGTPAQAGREAGSDLREGKRTPLVALARGAATWPEVEGALALAHTGPVAVRRARLELERSGARDEVAKLVEQHLESARSLARSFSNGVAALVEDVATEIEGRMP